MNLTPEQVDNLIAFLHQHTKEGTEQAKRLQNIEKVLTNRKKGEEQNVGNTDCDNQFTRNTERTI